MFLKRKTYVFFLRFQEWIFLYHKNKKRRTFFRAALQEF